MFYTDSDQALFFFINAPKNEAIQRFLKANNGAPANVASDDNITEVLGYEVGTSGDWTVFANYLAEDPWHYSEEFPMADVAQQNDAVYAYYSTDQCAGVLIVTQNGKAVRRFYEYPEEHELVGDNINIGALAYETENPITSWLDVIDFINHLLEGNALSQ